MTEPTFNPAYRIARCGQQSIHPPHVVDHGPDQPRNCPGTGDASGYVCDGCGDQAEIWIDDRPLCRREPEAEARLAAGEAS